MEQAQSWIDHLGLIAHPEGGYYRESYRSEKEIDGEPAIPGVQGRRALGTAIYFLLRAGECSHFHRLLADEIWHFYAGNPIRIHLLHAQGGYSTLELGQGGPGSGNLLQAVVPARTWFAVEVIEANGFALMGCTMAPGFDFADFELAGSAALCEAYPEHADWIPSLCIR